MRWRDALLFIAAAGLSGCAGGASLTAEQACSCAGYYGKQAKPSWVDAGDAITAENYRTAGIANCTGVQTFDTQKVDISARAKLSRMLAVRSDVRLSETRKDYGGGPGYATASIEATQISQTLLEDSKIYARWVDPQNCIIYAAAEISTANIEKQRRELAEKQAARLVNQSFNVKADGPQAALLIGEGKALLSDLGVSKISDRASHILTLSFSATERQATYLRGRLTASIETAAGTTVWSRTENSKGVSFQTLSEKALTSRAITDGAARMKEKLREALFE